MPPVPAPCGGNVRPVAVSRPETVNLRARPWVPAPCGGNVGSAQPKMPQPNSAPTAQPKPAPWSPASPPRPAFVAPPAPPVRTRSPALQSTVQRASLSKGKAMALENALLDEIAMAEDAGDAKRAAELTSAFYGFETGSNKRETKTALVASGASAATTTMLDWTTVRGANYPSGYDAKADAERDNYVNTHKKPTDSTQWQCPGAGTAARPAHWAAVSDATIDHTMPVADHWNRFGYNQTRAQRNAWYNDVKNHTYVCRSCNSSMGSGGIVYSRAPGPDYKG